MTEIGRIAISVSDPSTEELERNGLTVHHVQHAFVELVRQILSAGGELAYGGDFRSGGFTDTMASLLHTYSHLDRPPAERIRQYLAPYVYERADEEEVERLAKVATIVVVDPPAATEETFRAAQLLEMRKRMNEETDARIVLGGRLEGQSGRWPGVVEEAYLAAASERPLFVLGGAGGAAERIARASRGEWPDELTEGFQLERSPAHGPAAAAEIGPSEERLRRALEEPAPRNGLSAEENEALQLAGDPDLMAALVMRGLARFSMEQARQWPAT